MCLIHSWFSAPVTVLEQSRLTANVAKGETGCSQLRGAGSSGRQGVWCVVAGASFRPPVGVAEVALRGERRGEGGPGV